MGEIHVSEPPGEGCLPGFAGLAAWREGKGGEVRWLTGAGRIQADGDGKGVRYYPDGSEVDEDGAEEGS